MVDIMPYQQQSLEIIARHTSYSGKKILEIGGDTNGNVASKLLDLGALDVWSINIDDTYHNRDIGNMHTRRLSAYELECYFESDAFDIVLGIAILEHVDDIESLSRAIRAVIKPGGVVYLQGGPFWTSCHGHHVVYVADGRFYAFNGDNPVPDWLHLLQEPPDAAEILSSSGIPLAHVQGMIEQIYNSVHINRKKYSEIKQILYNSDLSLYHVEEDIRRRPDDFTVAKLAGRGWNLSEPFGVYSADFVFLP